MNNLIEQVLSSTNLEKLAYSLNCFLEYVDAHENASRCFKQLNASIKQECAKYLMRHILYENENLYSFFDENESVLIYLDLLWPQNKSCKQSRKQLMKIIEDISIQITEPQGPIISNDSINKIMNYLNTECDFCSAVLKNKLFFILRFPYSNKKWNACCYTTCNKTNLISHHLFLYHVNLDELSSSEYVFLHELGHFLQIAVTADATVVPKSFLEIAEPFFPGIRNDFPEQAPEIFADCFAMGIMVNSPFEAHDPYTGIRKEDKKLFKLYMSALISALST